MEDDKVQKLLERHFEDDKVSFSKIQDMLHDQNVDSTEYRTILLDHIKRIEPMITSYEIDTAFQKSLGIKGKKWGGRIIAFAALIGAWYVIKEFFIKLFLMK